MKYLVRLDELKQKVEFMTKQLLIIEEQIEEMNKVKGSFIWEGDASKTFMNNYTKYVGELVTIRNGIEVIIKYLTTYYDKYGATYANLRKTLQTENGSKVIYHG